MLRIYIIMLLVTLSSLSIGQTRDTISIVSDYKKEEGLRLKWFPYGDAAFLEGLEKGYNLYRSEVLKTTNGSEELGEYIKLNNTLIAYYSEDLLNEEYKKDTTLGFAGVLIEGVDELRNDNTTTVQEAEDLQSKRDLFYFLGLMSSVSNNNFAKAIGLSYTDATAQEGKKYMYRLEMEGNQGYTSYHFVRKVKEKTMPKIMGLTGQLGNGVVNLSWYKNKSRNYPYYNVYRADKKKGEYKKLTLSPHVGDIHNKIHPDFVMYYDSIPEYGKTYYYKVTGVGSFEQESEKSDFFEINTNYLLQYGATIDKVEQHNPNTMDLTITWNTDTLDAPYINEYAVFRSSEGITNYKKINKKALGTDTRSFVDKTDKSGSNYYIVTSYGAEGDSVNSVMVSKLLLDSIPPAKPVFIKGKCDSMGVVELKWELNQEEDLLGYRIFRSYDTTQDANRVIPGDTLASSFIDSVDLEKKITKVYYRIYALDQHYNPSLPSDYLEVKLPDLIPPTSGFLTNYEVKFEGIQLTWKNSGADDLAKTYLMRKADIDFDYRPIAVFNRLDSITSYLDTTTKTDVKYKYGLVAEDESGLRSDLSRTIQITQFNKEKKKPVKNLQAFASKETRQIKLVWEYNAKAAGFIVYRAEEDKPLEVHRHIDGKDREFYDKNVKPNTTYTYLMIGEIKGGYKSGYSKKIEVKY